MTLAECIERYESANVTPISRPTTVLTPKGHATVAIRRAIEAISALEPHDQAETLALFAGSLRAVIDGLTGGNRAS